MKLIWDFDELFNFGDRLVDSKKFTETCKAMTKELAAVFHEMLIKNTPVKTGTLQSFWHTGENYAYTIKVQKNGYKVELTNKAVYALPVNDGHYSYNQYNVGGEPYVVKNRTPKMYPEGGSNNDSTFVFGHFFVEKTIVDLEDSSKLEKVIESELQKWFRWCING